MAISVAQLDKLVDSARWLVHWAFTAFSALGPQTPYLTGAMI